MSASTYVYDYYYPLSGLGENEFLPGWARTMSMSCWVWNNEEETGEDVDVPITSVTISASGTWNDSGDKVSDNKGNDRVEINDNGDGTWNIWVNDDQDNPAYGWVTFNYKYTALEDGKTKSGKVEISINQHYYGLEESYPNDADKMLPESTMNIDFSLYHDIAWEADGYEDDFSLKITDEGDNAYDTDLISAKVNGKTITVTSKKETGSTDILVTAYQGDEERTSVWVSVTVEDEYYLIQPASLTKGDENVNPNIGEELNLNDYNPQIMLYNSENPNGTPVSGDNYRIRLNMGEESVNPNCWDVKEGTENDLIPTLIRKNTEGNDFTLIAEENTAGEGEEENWEQMTSRTYWFDGLNYDVDFEYSYDGNDNDNFYSGEENALTITLAQPEDTAAWPEGYEVEWSVKKVVDDENDIFEELSESDPVSYEFSENKQAITLTAEEGDDLDFNIVVGAKIILNGETIAENDTWRWVRNPSYDYDFPANEPGEWDLLPGWTYDIDSTMNCYVENATYPDGKDVTVNIDNLEIASQGDWDEDGNETERDDLTVVDLEAKNEGGWRVTAKGYGWAKLNLTYLSQEDDTEQTEEIWFYVSSEKYSLEFTYPDNTENMKQNSQMDVEAKLLYQWQDEDGKEDSKYISDYELEIDTDEEGNVSYDTDLLDASVSGEGETKTISVKSGNDSGYEDIRLTAYRTNEDGEKEEVRESYFNINVLDCDEHNYGEWTVTKKATSTKAGEKTRTCENCGHNETEEIEATGGQSSDDSTEKKQSSSGTKGTSTTSTLKVGASYTDKKTGTVYKVTGKNTMEYKKAPKKAKSVSIPKTVKVRGKVYKVTSIAANAFKNCKKLKKVVIPATIKKIGKQAFYGCKNLKKITIKTTKLTKKTVGAKAFKGINAKAKIKVPKKKLKAYKKILKAKGVGKKVKITK